MKVVSLFTLIKHIIRFVVASETFAFVFRLDRLDKGIELRFANNQIVLDCPSQQSVS